MNTTAPSVAIAILNWNGKKFLEALLPHLLSLTYPNYTVYIIDNNSSDGSSDYVKQFYPSVRLVQLDSNYGFAGGYNRGFQQMQEEYWLMMNSDVEVPKSFVEPLVGMMEKDKRVAMCQPKILSQINHSMLEHGGAAGGMIDFLGYPFCRGRVFDTVEADKGQYETPAEIFWASGACSLIRRDAFNEVGGFYDFYFMHSEEIDLCWRMIAQGWKIMYCPSSFIYHLGGGTLSYQNTRKTYLNFRNNIIMCVRNSPWYFTAWLLPVRIALDLSASLQYLLKKDTANAAAVVKAYGDFFKWLASKDKSYPAKKRSLLSITVVLKKSVAWQYYIRKKKYYSQLR